MRSWEWPYRLSYAFAGNFHQYLYLPLRHPSSFRILELQPDHHSNPIHCKLVNASLEEAPNYEALSYCWGGLGDTQIINCNGRKVHITNNLHEALLNLRRPGRKRSLWVDALCINQRDYAERNQQLRLMGRIYRKANKVIAWIGGESEATGPVKDMFGRLRALESRFGGLITLEPSAQQLRDLGLPEESSPIWSALRYFFRRAWFQRVWVIQEAANASQLDVTCGQLHMEWDDLVYAARCLAESPMFAATDTAQICQHIGFIDECRRMMQQGTDDRLSLFNLLHRSRRCGATDLRDKIYGLYPLIHDQSTLPEPNYEKAIHTLYKETAIHLIRTTGRLDVLSYAGAARAPHTRSLHLPSWVPDWHSHDKSTSLAPHSKTPAFHTEYEVSQDLTKLTLNADILDEVISLSDPILPFRGTLKGENINRVFQQWPDSTVLLEPTGETVRAIDIFPRGAALNDFNFPSLPSVSYNKGWLESERNQLTRIFYGRRIFRSTRGRLGLVPAHATLGDRIATFSGASVPFVIRRKENTYSLIGECFSADLMEGLSFKNYDIATKITLE